MLSMVDYVHMRLESYGKVHRGVDMTTGNGHDSLKLLELCDEVYAFGVQQEALDSTRALIGDRENAHLILDNHANVDLYIDDCDITVFNLGYLPLGSHIVTTMLETTKIAIEKAIQLSNKAVFIVVYPGHSEGSRESIWIDQYAETLSSKDFNVSKYCMLNKNKAPYVIEIEKRIKNKKKQ